MHMWSLILSLEKHAENNMLTSPILVITYMAFIEAPLQGTNLFGGAQLFVYRAQKYGKEISIMCFLGFFNIIIGSLGGVIIPKSRIADSWSIVILFRTFLDRPTNRLNLDLRSPYLLPKDFKRHKKYGNIIETYYFCKYGNHVFFFWTFESPMYNFNV